MQRNNASGAASKQVNKEVMGIPGCVIDFIGCAGAPEFDNVDDLFLCVTTPIRCSSRNRAQPLCLDARSEFPIQCV